MKFSRLLESIHSTKSPDLCTESELKASKDYTPKQNQSNKLTDDQTELRFFEIKRTGNQNNFQAKSKRIKIEEPNTSETVEQRRID